MHPWVWGKGAFHFIITSPPLANASHLFGVGTVTGDAFVHIPNGWLDHQPPSVDGKTLFACARAYNDLLRDAQGGIDIQSTQQDNRKKSAIGSENDTEINQLTFPVATLNRRTIPS